ncbi:hypothetical protein [Sphaerisporangium perillae]|uniref:hypothetical protein n=1 Tax=Sphaerisporangium perillae TaxID=2935860 RepID=UPI00200C72F6|nr:hypothetical protein [Sphaerisporangium perillae]
MRVADRVAVLDVRGVAVVARVARAEGVVVRARVRVVGRAVGSVVVGVVVRARDDGLVVGSAAPMEGCCREQARVAMTVPAPIAAAIGHSTSPKAASRVSPL